MPNFLDKLKKGMNVKNIKGDDEIEEADDSKNEEADEAEKNLDQNSDDTENKDESTNEETNADSNGKKEKEDILAVPLGPEKLSQEELEKKLGEKIDDSGEIKTAGVKDLLLSNIKEIDKKPKKTKKKQSSGLIAKKIFEPAREMAKEILKESENWLEPEGQLVIDVYETDDEIVIQSAIAGINPENLDICIEKDMVSIKGKRENSIEKKGRNYLIEECYWGAFSREIILPSEVDAEKAEASMKNGVLTIKAPKIEREKKKLTVK